jgi:hypothetical protein
MYDFIASQVLYMQKLNYILKKIVDLILRHSMFNGVIDSREIRSHMLRSYSF